MHIPTFGLTQEIAYLFVGIYMIARGSVQLPQEVPLWVQTLMILSYSVIGMFFLYLSGVAR